MSEPDSDALRIFGLTAAVFIVVLFGLVLPWLHGYSSPVWTWIIAAVLTAWSLIFPAGLGRVYRAWMKVASVLGKVNTMLLLSLAFFFILAPVGIAMRLFGYDPLQRKFMPLARSYRKPGMEKKSDDMEKPY